MKFFDKKRLLPLGLTSLMLLFMAPVSSQTRTDDLVVVTGYVTDAALSTPMAGVKVQAYNISRYSAMTKEDGSFTIRIPDYVSSLTFSLDGCNTVKKCTGFLIHNRIRAATRMDGIKPVVRHGGNVLGKDTGRVDDNPSGGCCSGNCSSCGGCQ